MSESTTELLPMHGMSIGDRLIVGERDILVLYTDRHLSPEETAGATSTIKKAFSKAGRKAPSILIVDRGFSLEVISERTTP